MKNLKIIPILVLILLFSNCNRKNDQITHTTDYDKYLNIKGNKSIDFANKELDFWQKKYNATPVQTSYLSMMASNHATLFFFT